MAGRALPYNTTKAEAQDRDERNAMGEEKERNERRSGKGWEKRWKEMREDTEKDERRNGKRWEKKRKAMEEEKESDERRSGKRWEKKRKAMGGEAESDGRRRPVPCPNNLHYSRTSDAVRCIRDCSVLQAATQCAASGNAARCVFPTIIFPLPRHVARPHTSSPSTAEASRLPARMPEPGGFRWK